MANNDSIIGGVMAAVGTIGILVEFWLLILSPILDPAPPFEAKYFWAISIPLFLGVAGVLVIVLWIGITMIQTPPPEAWDFDDLDEELGEDEDSTAEEKTETKSKSKPKKQAETSSDDISSIDGVTKTNKTVLVEAGFDTREKIAAATIEELSALKGIGKVSAEKIINNAK